VKHTGACKTVDQKRHLGYNSIYSQKTEQKMTKKHFIAMAKEIAQMPNMAERLTVAIAFCKVAASANPRFDQAKFLTACGV
jgi:hypothetical protein